MNHPSGINRRQFGFKSIGSAVAASAAAQTLWTQQGVWAQDAAAQCHDPRTKRFSWALSASVPVVPMT